MSAIRFKAKLDTISTWTILKVPKSASTKLPSRGMVLVLRTINGVSFKSPHRNSGDFSTVFIVIGLALTCVLPLLTWILINAAALSAQLSA